MRSFFLSISAIVTLVNFAEIGASSRCASSIKKHTAEALGQSAVDQLVAKYLTATPHASSEGMAVEDLGENPLSLIHRLRDSEFIAHDFYGNPWLIRHPSKSSGIWNSLSEREKIHLVKKLAYALVHPIEDFDSSTRATPPFSQILSKAQGLDRLKRFNEFETPDTQLGFDARRFFLLAQLNHYFRGSSIQSKRPPFQVLWDPLPYALAVALYYFGAPGEALVIRGGSMFERGPEKIWLEVEIDSLKPALLVSPSFLSETPLRNQNGRYKLVGWFGWENKAIGVLQQHAVHQTRVQTDFLKR